MSILDMLSEVAGGDTVRVLSQQLGADEGATAKAISGALPMLVTALAKNAGSSGGADALAGALRRDHDGSVLDNVNAFLGQGNQASSMGEGILRHVLGGRRGNVEQGLSKVSGLDAGSTGKLMAMLAPLVMGALAKEQSKTGMDAGALARMLGQESQVAQTREPSAMGMLGKLLDADGDGQIGDDVAKLGSSLLGSFLKRR